MPLYVCTCPIPAVQMLEVWLANPDMHVYVKEVSFDLGVSTSCHTDTMTMLLTVVVCLLVAM